MLFFGIKITTTKQEIMLHAMSLKGGSRTKSVQPFSCNLADKETNKQTNKQIKKSLNYNTLSPYRGRGKNRSKHIYTARHVGSESEALGIAETRPGVHFHCR